jgi:hypothetical protein
MEMSEAIPVLNQTPLTSETSRRNAIPKRQSLLVPEIQGLEKLISQVESGKE